MNSLVFWFMIEYGCFSSVNSNSTCPGQPGNGFNTLSVSENGGFCGVVQEKIGDDASKMELFTLQSNTPFG
jgi:hypothetical protein